MQKALGNATLNSQLVLSGIWNIVHPLQAHRMLQLPWESGIFKQIFGESHVMDNFGPPAILHVAAPAPREDAIAREVACLAPSTRIVAGYHTVVQF